jgi:hypothetical protein
MHQATIASKEEMRPIVFQRQTSKREYHCWLANTMWYMRKHSVWKDGDTELPTSWVVSCQATLERLKFGPPRLAARTSRYKHPSGSRTAKARYKSWSMVGRTCLKRRGMPNYYFTYLSLWFPLNMLYPYNSFYPKVGRSSPCHVEDTDMHDLRLCSNLYGIA